MRTRDSAGLALAPVFLRLGLAVVFVWAGLGKFMATMEVEGEQAAILANYGVIPNPHGPRAAPMPEARPESPGTDAPAEDGAPAPGSDGQAAGRGASSVRLVGLQDQPTVWAGAADFPEPVTVKRWAGLLLGLHTAVHPGLSADDSAALMPLWPDFDPSTDYDPWPKYAALAVSLTELVGGILLAVGLLTRLSALGIAGVMVGAMWLTVIGPAVQSGDTMLGVLPRHDAFDGEAWMTPLWQFSLFCMAVALFFAGPGTMSLDRLLLGGPPKPAPPKPAQAPPAKK
jgi:uncharacterized membrane protein YphA (DoxX/SURF4 family)